MIYFSIWYFLFLICQQFPALAPPANSRRNTAVARMMQHRPLPPPPKSAAQQVNHSSMADLMDIFTTPAPIVSNSSAGQQQGSPSQIASAATSVNNVEASTSSFGNTMTVENQQAHYSSTLLQMAANAGTTPSPSLNEKATPIAVAFIENISARLKGSDQLQWVAFSCLKLFSK